jgi:hypothetical protein
VRHFGIFRPDAGPTDSDRVVKMRDPMIPRAPDGVGLREGPSIALGHSGRVEQQRQPTTAGCDSGSHLT